MTALLATVSILLIIIYYLWIIRWNIAWNRLISYEATGLNATVKLSIIIPVRNEEANMEGVLNSLLAQHYPKHLMELIVSDDGSTDNTLKIAKQFFANHAQLNGSVIQQEHSSQSSSKKEALKRAIEKAGGELIITSDADCVHPVEWLQTIASYFSLHKPVMIVGPVVMRGDSSLLQQFQTLDYLSLQASGGASLALNQPLLCSGANLAFTKSAFYEVNGYEDNLHIASGDDTFLMLKMNKRFSGKVHFIKSKQAIVSTVCCASLSDFLQQRTRWISKTKQYSNKFITTIGTFFLLVNSCFIFLLIGCIYNPTLLCLAVAYLLAKSIIDFVFLTSASKFFGFTINILSFLWMELLYTFYLLAVLKGFLSGSYQWKSRNHNS